MPCPGSMRPCQVPAPAVVVLNREPVCALFAAVRFFDSATGKQIGEPVTHNLEICELALNLAGANTERKLVFIDRNRDLYITPILVRRALARLTSLRRVKLVTHTQPSLVTEFGSRDSMSSQPCITQSIPRILTRTRCPSSILPTEEFPCLYCRKLIMRELRV